MLSSTTPLLRCPRLMPQASPCRGELALISGSTVQGSSADVFEVTTGSLRCRKCESEFPILAGVAILVDDVGFYLCSHVKGIAQIVADDDIPTEYLSDYLEAKDEIEPEHIEEDLESERVNALYLINHYLHARQAPGEKPWWMPLTGEGSPLIDRLVREHWDNGPFAQVERRVAELAKSASAAPDTIELGCGLGGLLPVLKIHLKSYLGVDSSFASIALARHLTLGTAYPRKTLIPGDLLQGPVSREIALPAPPSFDGRADFVVGDLDDLPVQSGRWDLSIALNAIDMLDDPSVLPRTQHALLKKGGIAIQSCPYIWHEAVARKLRAEIPGSIQRSSEAAEYLYARAGFEIRDRVEHLPWLFFKHVRQLEIYSVHLFVASAR